MFVCNRHWFNRVPGANLRIVCLPSVTRAVVKVHSPDGSILPRFIIDLTIYMNIKAPHQCSYTKKPASQISKRLLQLSKFLGKISTAFALISSESNVDASCCGSYFAALLHQLPPPHLSKCQLLTTKVLMGKFKQIFTHHTQMCL